MKKVKLSTSFWLGDTVYGVLAFSVGEGNKIKYDYFYINVSVKIFEV